MIRLTQPFSVEGSLCQKDIENLKEWRFEATPDQSDMLTKQGREDLYQLGQRVRSYFPELFEGNPTTYSPDKFVVSTLVTCDIELNIHYVITVQLPLTDHYLSTKN